MATAIIYALGYNFLRCNEVAELFGVNKYSINTLLDKILSARIGYFTLRLEKGTIIIIIIIIVYS